MTHLQKIKEFSIYETQSSNFKYNLSMVNNIVSKYNVLNVLIENILPNSCQLFAMKYHSQDLEVTWLDLLLEFMKVFNDDLTIIEQCSSILANSASYIKHMLPTSRYS